MSEALLTVRGLKAGYGDGRLIVDGVDSTSAPARSSP